jgi:TolB-like protein
MRVRTVYLLIGAALASQAGGCGVYTTRARLPSHLKTVYIETFENKTNEYLLPQQIAEGLVARFQDEGDLRVVTSPAADATIEGTILDYAEEPLSYVGSGDVLQRKVRITVDVRFVDQLDDKVLWEDKQMERWAVYDSQTEQKDDGIRRTVDKLATDIITQALKGW